MKIYERIKNLAHKQNQSLIVISELCGLSENYIYQLKDGQSPSAENLALIANELNCSVDYLVGRCDEI